MKSTRLPDAEFAVMEIIWELPAPVTIGQVREKLSEEKSWKLQTLVTLFGRLTERGFLRVDEKKRGREHLFYPTLTREEYLRMEMESVPEPLPPAPPAVAAGRHSPENS